MMQRILYVGDESLDKSLCVALRDRRFEITESDSPRALTVLTNETFGLLIIDLRDANEAVDLLKAVRAEARLHNLQTLVIAEWGTGQPTFALSQGADAFEPAPIDAGRLVESVEKLLRPRMVMTATASTADIEAAE